MQEGLLVPPLLYNVRRDAVQRTLGWDGVWSEINPARKSLLVPPPRLAPATPPLPSVVAGAVCLASPPRHALPSMRTWSDSGVVT